MRFVSIITLATAIAGVAAAPFKFPLADGFPNPSPNALAQIVKKAQGSPPNGPLPKSLKDTGHTTLQLIAHNELFEVAFFDELLTNVTKEVEGYSTKPIEKKYVVDTLTAVVNQEKLHAAGVNGILKNAGRPEIQPCQYQFPISTFLEAITLANTFTDVVLGTLPEAQVAFSKDAGDESPLVPLIGSVIAQEGEQNGFYRAVQRKTPSAAPFLTGGSPSFAFTAIQNFIVPDSCPVPLTSIDLKTFGPLTVVTKPEAKNMTLEFMVPGPVSPETNSIVYLSGQNLPLTEPITLCGSSGSMTNFKTSFPFESGFANGLTIAALVKGTESFTSNDDVAAATVYGPGLIEVD